MTAFWIVAGLLLAGALMFVLPPLLVRSTGSLRADRGEINLAVHRDQLAELEADLRAGAIERAQYDSARREIEQRALDDAGAQVPAQAAPVRSGNPGRWSALVVGLAVPLLAVGLYALLGNPAGLERQVAAPPAPAAKHALTPEQIAQMVEQLAARLREKPDDAEGWAMLARSYGVLRRYEDAVGAYAAAAKLAGDNPQLLADYADMLALTRGRKLAGEPYALIKRALAVDPRHVKALALAGTAEFESGNFEAAIAHWQRIVAIVPPESDVARSIDGSIRQARQRLGTVPVPVAAAGAPGTPAGKTGEVQGTVTLGAGLAARAAPGDTVFVFARAAQGPRMPLAIQRAVVRDLPLRFRLDDAMAMNPAMKLSGAGTVVIGARVSRSGSATPAAGDLEGVSGPIAVGADDVRVVIDRVVQ